MDTTETYIKMCNCDEIQMDTGYLLGGKDFYEDGTWLPRQDQLQEMVEGQLWDRFDKFSVWSHNKYGFPGAWSDWTLRFTSMEQLWLAFVMKEKHNKTWDGGKWYA